MVSLEGCFEKAKWATSDVARAICALQGIAWISCTRRRIHSESDPYKVGRSLSFHVPQVVYFSFSVNHHHSLFVLLDLERKLSRTTMMTRQVDHGNSHRRALRSTALWRETSGNRRWKCRDYRNGSSPHRVTCPCIDCGHQRCDSCRIHKPRSKSQHTHITTPKLGAMASIPTAHISFTASHYDDAESIDDLRDAIVTPCGWSSTAKEDACAQCPLFKEADESSHDINCHAKIAEINWRDCQPCNGTSPANLSNRKCPDCGHPQVTCWISHIRRAERCSDRLPALINQVLKQWVKEQQLEHPDHSDTSSSSSRFPRSPLHICALLGFLVLARVYLEMSYNPNALAQPGGQTALHMAAAGAQLPMIRLLLAWNADLEAQTASTKRTPLHIAAFRGNLEACKFFIESGASLKAKDSQGKTAVELAHAGGHGETAEFLLKAEVRSINLNVQGQTELKAPTPPVTADSESVKLAGLSPSALNSRTTTHPTTFSSAADWSTDSFSEGEHESGSSDGFESWEELHADSVHFSTDRAQ